MNNPITHITSTVGAAFFAAGSLCVDWVALQISEQSSPKVRNANPLDVELEPDFNAK